MAKPEAGTKPAGADRSGVPELAGPWPSQENLLGHVLGLPLVSEDPPGMGHETTPVFLSERGQGQGLGIRRLHVHSPWDWGRAGSPGSFQPERRPVPGV